MGFPVPVPTPTIGRTVLVKVDPLLNNGSDEASAVITRVWSDTLVNLRITYDGPPVPASGQARQDWVTSWPLHPSREAMQAAHDRARQASGHAPVHGAYWPTRQPGDRPDGR